MKVWREADGRVIVTHDDAGWARLLLVGAAIFLALAAYTFLGDPSNTERAWGSLGAFATCLLAGLVLFERSRFVVDPRTRVITWRRRRAVSRREGTLPFDQVNAVAVQTPIGDDGTPSRRIAFMTEEGELPISVAYAPDPDDECLAIADQLRGALGHAAGPGIAVNVRALVAAGRTMDAIRQLRQEQGLSLEDAKRQVDELRIRP